LWLSFDLPRLMPIVPRLAFSAGFRSRLLQKRSRRTLSSLSQDLPEQVQAVVIGGGVVGASALYHLAKGGWRDVILLERKVLTAGSSWHAAGGFHAIASDPNISRMQAYTINLYKELEAMTQQSCGVHLTGGVNIASTPARMEYLRNEAAKHRVMGIDSQLLTPDEVHSLCPIISTEGLLGGLYDANEGHLDCSGVVHAYAKAAKMLGAKVQEGVKVTGLVPTVRGSSAGWEVQTEKGAIFAEHVVNAGGLWAREVGEMAGVNVPILPLQHHYLITDTVPELEGHKRELPMVIDLDGNTYMRQERSGCLLGIYEAKSTAPWAAEGTPWDYGENQLLQPELERIGEYLHNAFQRYPALEQVGIRSIVNGPFTFAPDGNPNVGPVQGKPGYWDANGVMAGFAQAGGVGLVLSDWMIKGEVMGDFFAMDRARFGAFAGRQYVLQKAQENYARRFQINYPNEELPVARSLKTTPIFTELRERRHAVFGVTFGHEYPLFFAESPDTAFETPNFRRCPNAFQYIGAECHAARNTVGLLETSTFAKYQVDGPDAASWLDTVLACELPAVGKAKLAPMLSPSGRLRGDLTVIRVERDQFFLVGSGFLQDFHCRHFAALLDANRRVSVRNVTEEQLGFAIFGPNSRTLLQRLVSNSEDVSHDQFRFLSSRKMEVGMVPALVTRISVTGELGFEITAPVAYHERLFHALDSAGVDLGLRNIGARALNSLRIEKGFGAWGREFSEDYTPSESGLARFVAGNKTSEFQGKQAFVESSSAKPPRKLALMRLALPSTSSGTTAADATGWEPIWCADRCVGFITSGAYGHNVSASLALGYIESAVLDDAQQTTSLEVSILGERCGLEVLTGPLVDPSGARMRGPTEGTIPFASMSA